MYKKLFRIFTTFALLILSAPLIGQETFAEPTPCIGPIPNHTIDIIADAEFLWWYSSVTDLSYAIKGETVAAGQNTTQIVPKRKLNFDCKWQPGARIGLGVITNHDGWDVYSEWTYFHNHLNQQSRVSPFDSTNLQDGSTSPIGTQAFTSTWLIIPNGEFLQSIHAKWVLLFNQIDLQLGRKYWISRFFSLHPFAGLRGYWAIMDYNLKGSRPLRSQATFYETASFYKQRSWAVGLLTGFDVAWHINSNWSIFSDAAVSLTYGKYSVRRNASELEINQSNTVISNLSAKTMDSFYQTQPFVDLALGIRWEKLIHQSFRLQFDLGWENHFLFSFNQLFRGSAPSISSTDLPTLDGNLSLAGILVKGRIEF